MDMKKLHEKYLDEGSPSVEAQIRWLQKMQFAEHHIKQTMIIVYSELEANEIPKVWKKNIGTPKEERKYLSAKDTYLNREKVWSGKDISTGDDLCQYLLEVAKRIRTKELTALVGTIEKFEADMRKKWENDQKKKKSWIKRIFT